MINMNGRQNEYWTASPLRPKSGSNIAKLLLTLHIRFVLAGHSLFLSPVHAPWWAVYKDRSHLNDEKVLP